MMNAAAGFGEGFGLPPVLDDWYCFTTLSSIFTKILEKKTTRQFGLLTPHYTLHGSCKIYALEILAIVAINGLVTLVNLNTI